MMQTKLIIIFFLSNLVFAKSIDEIIEAKKRAVLLISIYDKKTEKRTFEGGGFFTDSKGHFITNFHVIEDYVNNPKDYLIRFRDFKGIEFDNIEILKCSDKNKIDLCYGAIKTEQKVYFFDVLNKTPIKTQLFSLIGHNNSNYFSTRKGEVGDITSNINDRFSIEKDKRENINSKLIELVNYSYPNNKCRGDSGCPIFDALSGDLMGVFTVCFSSKTKNDNHKMAIDSKAIYAFINNDSNLNHLTIPNDSIYKKKDESKSSDNSDEKGNEFETEKKTGKLEK